MGASQGYSGPELKQPESSELDCLGARRPRPSLLAPVQEVEEVVAKQFSLLWQLDDPRPPALVEPPSVQAAPAPPPRQQQKSASERWRCQGSTAC